MFQTSAGYSGSKFSSATGFWASFEQVHSLAPVCHCYNKQICIRNCASECYRIGWVNVRPEGVWYCHIWRDRLVFRRIFPFRCAAYLAWAFSVPFRAMHVRVVPLRPLLLFWSWKIRPRRRSRPNLTGRQAVFEPLSSFFPVASSPNLASDWSVLGSWSSNCSSMVLRLNFLTDRF